MEFVLSRLHSLSGQAGPEDVQQIHLVTVILYRLWCCQRCGWGRTPRMKEDVE